MLLTQSPVQYSALAFASAFPTKTLSLHFQYPLTLQPEQPFSLDASDPNKNPLFSLHKSLVNIESISGNEQAIGEFLEAFLKSKNYTVDRQYLGLVPTNHQHSPLLGRHKQRFNLLAYPGEKRQTPVLLSSVSNTFQAIIFSFGAFFRALVRAGGPSRQLVCSSICHQVVLD